MYSESLDRREFLACLTALVAAPQRWPGGAVSVEALPTVFYSHPEGRTTLVRFVVTGTDAPAGRLRVFSRAGQALGTAGVVALGGRLYGELWLPPERELTTVLELFRTRTQVRTSHRLTHKRRWLVYWITVSDPGAIVAKVRGLSPLIDQAALSAIRSEVLLNPIGEEPDLAWLDHAPFLSSVSRAVAAAGEINLPVSPVAVDHGGAGPRPSTFPTLLARAGVEWIATRTDGAATTLAGRDGSLVRVLPLGERGSPESLGLFTGATEMSRRIEAWLEQPPYNAPWYSQPLALLVGTDPADQGRAAATVDEWNTRFAFPRIIAGRIDEFMAEAARMTPPQQAAAAASEPPAPSPGQLARVIGERHAERDRRVARMLDPLIRRIGPAEAGLNALAAQFAFPVPGTLVFNPAPFSRTDIAVMPDRTERIVTDVPALGYVCVPYPGHAGEPAPAWRGEATDVFSLGTGVSTISVDRSTGAIDSLTATEHQWVRPGGAWNAVAGTRLASARLERHGGIGSRLVLTRVGPGNVTWKSIITVSSQLPWIEIENVWPDAGEPVTCQFAVTLDQVSVRWEIPAGFEQRAAPVSQMAVLRWIRLEAGPRMVTFCAPDAPAASVSADGLLSCTGPRGRMRFRVLLASGWNSPEDPWRAGWTAEPFRTAPVPGTGLATLPSFGSLIRVDQAGVIVLDLRAAAEDGLIVVLQEVLGVSRPVTLGPGVLDFTGGTVIDLLERPLGDATRLGAGGVAVPIDAYGVTAVRLSGVRIAGG